MSDTFGLKLGIEGEKAFKESLREINQNFKVLASEMTLVTSEFDKNDRSVQAVTARNAVLNKEIDTQKDKISTLEQALANASDSFGENDKRTQAWVVQLNNAKAELNNMNQELAQNNQTLVDHASGFTFAEQAEKAFSDSLSEIGQRFKVLGSEINLVTSQYDKYDRSVAALSARNVVLSQEIDTQKEKVGILERALASSSTAFGENDKRTQEWAAKLNNAKSELNGMERELSKNEKGIQDAARGYNDAGKKVDEFGNEIEDASEKTSVFGDVLKANLAADAIKAGLGSLVSLIKDVGAAVSNYVGEGSDMAKTAAENHAKLSQVMRNTMDASDAEIESIMELARAQEQLGIVSATAQVGGAQELGTYLEKSETLKGLIPVMNDMIAQQYGVNASQESAVNIATMLGKVMNGQVGALSKYGYTFDEIQENILKYGTEAERAAVLAEVVGESVGGMNQALAQTDAGKMASLTTILDNTKIKVGELANDFQAQIMGRMLPSVDALSSAFLGVLNGEGSPEEMAAAFNDVFDEIESIINDFLPVLLDLGVQLITAVVTGIADNIGVITETAMNLIQTLVETISELLPTVIDAGLQLLLGLVDGIIQALPALVDAAMEAIVTLANGLAEALPELVPVIIETILFIVDTLLNNLDSLLDAALAIIMGLADGLIAALPKLIEALPKIIESIINFLVNSIPKIIEMGVELVVKLALGLVQAIPQLVAALPEILAAIIKGIISWYSNIGEMGKNIIKSLWEGIKSMGQWLSDSFSDMVAGIVNGIVNAINSIFGTKIPTMKVKAAVETSPVSVAVSQDSVRKTTGALAEVANESVKQADYANEAILTSAREAAEERIAQEKSVTKGKSAEAKEQERIAKDLAKEEQRIAKENADEINRLGSDLTKAIKEQYSEQKAVCLQALDDEVAAVKSASYEKIRIYDAEYAEKMKLLDDEESYRLGAIQAEIDALDEKTRAEDRALRQKDYEDKLAELKIKFKAAQTRKEQEDIQNEVNRLVAARQREITLEQRNAQKELLKQQLADEKEKLKAAKDTLQQSKLDALTVQKETLKEQFDALMSSENLQAEALQLLISGQQDDILNLLETYYPEWKNAGKTFAEMLGAGVSEGTEDVQRRLAETLRVINAIQPTAQTASNTMQTSPSQPNNITGAVGSGNMASVHSERFENDMRSCLSGIQGTLETVIQSIKPVAADIYALFQNPIRDEFAGLRGKLDSVVDAIHNLQALASEPRVIITNNFNGVTAADVPHMVDRENTALLRRLRPSMG